MLQRRLSLTTAIAEITRLNAWLDRSFAEAGVAAPAAADMKLCLNEAVANAILYAFAGQSEPRLVVTLRLRPERVGATVVDNGRPFDPLAWPRREKLSGIADAVPGGFGIQLMRDTASSVDYRREGGENRLRIVCGR